MSATARRRRPWGQRWAELGAGLARGLSAALALASTPALAQNQPAPAETMPGFATMGPQPFAPSPVAPPPSIEPLPGCAQRLCNVRALGGFLRQLGANPPRQLHILQIGDSLTIGNMIPQGWRLPLQQAHGSAGRGVVPPGLPFVGYHTSGVTAQSSAGWSTRALFGPAWRPDGPLLGLSGFTQTALHAGATLSYTADDAANRFARVTVCALTGPGAGSYRALFDDGSVRVVVLGAPEAGVRCDDFVPETPMAHFTLATLDEAPVSLTSLGFFGAGPGVIVSNLGVVGAQMLHQTRTDDRVFATELGHYHPDMVVIAFGTNEAFDPGFSPSAFHETLRRMVARLRSMLGPDLPIMLLAPPDAATRNMALGRPGSPDAHMCERGLMVPVSLAAVRREQALAASQLGLALWNAGAAMGGTCSSVSWANQGLMRPDMVHITREGGLLLGAQLAADLEGAAASPLLR